MHTNLFTSPNDFSLLCKVRNSPYLDLSTLINVNDEVHKPPDLFDELSGVLIISLRLPIPSHEQGGGTYHSLVDGMSMTVRIGLCPSLICEPVNVLGKVPISFSIGILHRQCHTLHHQVMTYTSRIRRCHLDHLALPLFLDGTRVVCTLGSST